MTTQLNPSEISELIKDRIKNFEASAEARTEGTVVSLTDGIARIHGLAEAMSGEMLEFPGDVYGLALNEDQKARLSTALEQHLGCSVSLEETIDEKLLGGAILKAGDLVIDGSAAGRIQKLAASLAR